MLLSVDHGNYAIKTPFFSFVSGLSEHTSCPPLADELLEYDDRFWTLSGKRISYMRDKTQDDLRQFFQLCHDLYLLHRNWEQRHGIVNVHQVIH